MLYGYATKSRGKREKERKDTVETGKILGESENRVKQNKKKRRMWTIVCVCMYVCISMYRCTEAKGVKEESMKGTHMEERESWRYI